ncbi:MAG: DUF4330 domain-containing protein [Defluviitaleaceae bacterium]|nr:DUF4330 domain-containing protein [Defluviitaleaceae bacterium]
MIDNKGRLFGKISLVDLFVFTVLAAVIAVVYFNVGTGSRPVTGAEQSVLITFYNPALHDFTVQAVEIGARVINDTNETFMGTVEDIVIGDSVSFMPAVDGHEVATPMEGFSSIYITSRVQGRLSEGAVVLGGNVYGVGEEIIIWAGRAKTMLNISDIRLAD